MTTKEIICPIMSTADKKVNCTRDCAWAIPDPHIPKCAIVQIVEAIDNNADKINEIGLNLPND